MEVRTRLSGAEVGSLLAAILEYNGMRPTDVVFSSDGKPIDNLIAEVVCEHPGLKVRVEPEDQQDPLVRQMENVIALTPRVPS